MLDLSGLAKSYGAFTLGPLDLTVGDEVLAVLGPSGCGKTTLLSLVAGIETPDAGTVSLDGTPLDGRPPEDRGAALVFQDGALFPHLTARENVAYAATDSERVEELADTLEIRDVLDQPAPTLSGGQQQRVALARALAADPAALLLDEPLSNLDAPIRRRLRAELRPLLDGLDVPVVYVTHDQRGASALGDRVAVLGDGRVHQVDAPEAVFRRPATPYVAAFTGNPNVFEGYVRDGALRWGDATLALPDADRSGAVTFCVRPEHVRLASDDDATGGPSNVLDGRVRRRTFEGDGTRLDVALAAVDATLSVAVSTAPDGTAPAVGASVRVALPPRATHVFPDDGGGW